MNIKKLCKYEKSNRYELTSFTDNYLNVEDNIISYNVTDNSIKVNKYIVTEIIDDLKFTVNRTIELNKNIQFERSQIKCTLTFKYN